MEIAIIAKFKNNNFRRRREALGFPSIIAFCREHDFHYSQIWGYESFRDYPKKDFLIKRIERIFRCPIEDLFPPEYKEAVDRKLGRNIEKVVTLRELPPYMENAYLLPSPEALYEQAETKEQVEEMLKTITEREAKVLKLLYFEDLNLGEVGHRMNVSRERIRQIEGKALRKLKHPSRARFLRPWNYGKKTKAPEKLTVSEEADLFPLIKDCPECGQACFYCILEKRDPEHEVHPKDHKCFNMHIWPVYKKSKKGDEG